MQLAVLGIVVLAFVCAAATEQRRPEIALARLRGHGTVGAATMLLRELGLLVVIGAVLGTGLGWLAAEVATRLWLEPGVHPEWSSAVALAVLASVVAGLLAILAAATPTLRQPLTSLLRRVPPRASALQVGLVEGAVVAAAAAGVVTLLSGNGRPGRPARTGAARHRRWPAARPGDHPHRRPDSSPQPAAGAGSPRPWRLCRSPAARRCAA